MFTVSKSHGEEVSKLMRVSNVDDGNYSGDVELSEKEWVMDSKRPAFALQN
jgi:hypothetical protein